MKISVHLEADSAEELQAFFAKFAARPAQYIPAVDEDPVFASDEARAQRAQIEEPIEIVAEEPTTVEKPVEKKARKPRSPNKPKAAPEEPVPTPPVVTPPVIKPPVGPAPVIEVPTPVKTSRQELLDVFSEYVQRYGVSFGYTDISTLLQQTLGDGIRKASDVPDEALGEAVGAIRGAINDNPFNRKRDYA